MIEEFKSTEELYNRVFPALGLRINEARRDGLSSITEFDIWRYLIESKWRLSSNLMLSDIVNDIMIVDLNLVRKSITDHKI